jgi:hypothetical protein
MGMLLNPFWYSSSGGGSEPDPTVFSGATGWFDGGTTSLPGLADGGAVGSTTNWIDRVTGTRNWSQGSAGNRPVLHTTSGPNSKPYISFDSNDELAFSNTISQLISSSAYTVFAVIRPQRNGVNDDPWWCPQIIGVLNGYFGLSLRNAGSNKFALWEDRVSPSPRTGYVQSTTTFSQNVWYIVEAWFDGSSINIKVNNDTAVSLAFGGPGSLANTPSVGVGGLTSDLAALYVWNTDVGSANRGTFRTSLSSWFGITIP